MKRSSRLRRTACTCAVITAAILGICSPAAAASPATAGAYCVMDAQTGEVICQKNAYTRMEMASTTKVMTALVALECAAFPYRKDNTRRSGHRRLLDVFKSRRCVYA